MIEWMVGRERSAAAESVRAGRITIMMRQSKWSGQTGQTDIAKGMKVRRRIFEAAVRSKG